MRPGPKGSFDEISVKDPSIVFYQGQWEVFHGEAIRSGYNQKMEIKPGPWMLLVQGLRAEDHHGDYAELPWHMGLIVQDPPSSSPFSPCSPSQAWAWYKRVPPIKGCNYLPRTAVNSTEMWNPDTFSGKEPYPGKQQSPIPGIHNSGWVPSPGLSRVVDRSAWPDLRRYVTGVIGRFQRDRRILAWDLYNEPGNSNMGEKSLPLCEATFTWARSVQPGQPLTVGVWTDLESPMSQRIMSLCDIVSFHGYDTANGLR